MAKRKPAKIDPEISTWFERDRANVRLDDAKTGRTILDIWDEDVSELVEDGFLDPRDWQGSAVEYARHLGLIA